MGGICHRRRLFSPAAGEDGTSTAPYCPSCMASVAAVPPPRQKCCLARSLRGREARHIARDVLARETATRSRSCQCWLCVSAAGQRKPDREGMIRAAQHVSSVRPVIIEVGYQNGKGGFVRETGRHTSSPLPMKVFWRPVSQSTGRRKNPVHVLPLVLLYRILGFQMNATFPSFP